MLVLTVGAQASFKDMLAPQMHADAENVRSVLIERCGHYVAEEQPEQLVDELFHFFNETN